MKIAVIATSETLSLASTLIKALGEAGDQVYGLKFNDTWQNESRSRIDSLFKGATHIVCVVSALNSTANWLPFTVGYARGDGRRLSLFRNDPSWTPQPWLSDLSVLDHIDEAVAYFDSERTEWMIHESRRHARMSLLEMGISYHTDSYAQCVRDGDVKAVALFVDSGYPVDSRDKHGVIMLGLAARSHHLSVIELLLSRNADINLQSDDRGYSALMDATQLGDETIVRYLLDRGADPDIVSKDGQTALILAVGRNDVAITSLLLERGANHLIADKLGLTAVKYAKLFHNQAILDLFGNNILS